jgi:predicted nucleic acid-binding protein
MYLDTSVAVKLYIPEPDSAECEAIAGVDGFISSELLYGEMYAAVFGKERRGHISAESGKLILARFESDLSEGQIRLVKINGPVVRDAVEIMQQVRSDVLLRTLDAIHLATYLSVDAGSLFTRDKRMLVAANKLGLSLAG